MTKTKVKIYRTIYYLVNFIIALAICYLGSLTLNTDMIASLHTPKLITLGSVIFMTIMLEALLSYKLSHVDR